MGVVPAARAGYDPFALPAVLTPLAAASDKDPFLALLFKTHPAPEARIERLDTAMGARFDGFSVASQNAGRFAQATRILRVAGG